MIKLLLYVDDLIIIEKTANGLREHLKEMEIFFQEVGMEFNTKKSKFMIFSFKRNKKPLPLLSLRVTL